MMNSANNLKNNTHAASTSFITAQQVGPLAIITFIAAAAGLALGSI
jgi:hypothetical protein